MVAHTRDIARFTNATLIGRGGFGSVYRATDAEHGREVAIKVLQGTLGETERRRFDRERQTMGRLGAHPNITPVHESGYTDQGEGYIVMALAAKGSLADRLTHNGSVPWPEAVAVIAAIARAAQAAHDQGVLHRDIKPDNILIDAYDNPRLTDFGIAAVASNATATTSTTATIAHAAPEVLQGQPPTPAVDVYALGSTLYNLIIGRPPFQEPDDHGVPAMITRALTQPPPDLRQFGVPGRVAEIAARALAKDAAARPATAGQLADELEAALGGAASGDQAPTQVADSGPPTVVAGPPISPNPYAGNPTPPHTASPPPAQTPSPAPGHGPAPAHASASGHAASPYGHQGGGDYPVAQAAAGPASGGGGGSSRLLFLLAGATLAVVIGVGGVLALSSRNSDEPRGSAEAGTSSADTSSTELSSTAPSSTEPSSTEPSSTEPSSTEPSSAASSTTAASTTTEDQAETTTTTTTTTAVEAGACPNVTVLDTRTARFFVMICGTGSGRLTYVGENRSTGEGITLPACFLGGSTFLATNLGFEYLVDADRLLLIVSNPDGDEIVREALVPPADIDRTAALDPC